MGGEDAVISNLQDLVTILCVDYVYLPLSVARLPLIWRAKSAESAEEKRMYL